VEKVQPTRESKVSCGNEGKSWQMPSRRQRYGSTFRLRKKPKNASKNIGEMPVSKQTAKGKVRPVKGKRTAAHGGNTRTSVEGALTTANWKLFAQWNGMESRDERPYTF